MAEKLLQHLNAVSGDHQQLRSLLSQWNFDRELIPKALQNISTIFPHFSRHDVSHSMQILINIERLLGESLKSLTATDTWLILEAAYWHDVGMLVTSDDIVQDMRSAEFKRYLNEIASQSDHELQAFAQSFLSLDPKDCFASAETPVEAMQKYRQVLAGYYRDRHSERSSDIVADPWEKVGIASPRTELIPNRLFRLLGQICRMHGRAFEALLENLPFCGN
jgi:hypothetical protein